MTIEVPSTLRCFYRIAWMLKTPSWHHNELSRVVASVVTRYLAKHKRIPLCDVVQDMLMAFYFFTGLDGSPQRRWILKHRMMNLDYGFISSALGLEWPWRLEARRKQRKNRILSYVFVVFVHDSRLLGWLSLDIHRLRIWPCILIATLVTGRAEEKACLLRIHLTDLVFHLKQPWLFSSFAWSLVLTLQTSAFEAMQKLTSLDATGRHCKANIWHEGDGLAVVVARQVWLKDAFSSSFSKR